MVGSGERQSKRTCMERTALNWSRTQSSDYVGTRVQSEAPAVQQALVRPMPDRSPLPEEQEQSSRRVVGPERIRQSRRLGSSWAGSTDRRRGGKMLGNAETACHAKLKGAGLS